jgi:hypothetical protein
MSLRLRLTALTVIIVLGIATAVGYVLVNRSQQQAIAHRVPTSAQTPLANINAQSHIVFRNTELGTEYGLVAEVSLTDPSGPRAVTTSNCDRVYAAKQQVLCLSSTLGAVNTYAAHILNTSFAPTQELPLTGIPSRARLSPDGTLAATTSFTAGDSYAGTSFSTRTVISRVGGKSIGDLEDFKLIHDGQSINPVDRNYWGVTFAADDNTFYATVEWAGHTWLVHGNIAQRQVVTVHEDAECPSLSPDGTHVVYKQRGDLPIGQWRLVSYDIATGTVTPLAETRSVDDQVAWLDDNHVIYGLPRTGSEAAVDDVWSVPADGTGTPTVLIPQAWSPAVVRD